MRLLKSWVESANSATTEFPLNNLPYGVFALGEDEEPRCGVAIGDKIVDIRALEEIGLIDLSDEPVFDVPFWNILMELGPEAWGVFRRELTDLLSAGSKGRAEIEPHLYPLEDVDLFMPLIVSGYTDFYASKHHAMNVGTMFRGAENALPPNWLHIPIGYNGRASSLVVSGADVIRPNGQLKGPNDAAPRFGPCERFDFELEIGAIVGQASEGMISVAEADTNIFGYVLLNDWSARDVQAWEYQPLGPFQAKASATTISPWIVTRAALEPFRTSTPEREKELLPYLAEPGPMLYDIKLEVTLAPEGKDATVITRTNYSEMYYSAPQQLCHHTTSGCAMDVGDILGSGTISGPTKESRGSMLELSWGGKEPMTLDSGDTRSFLQDGDTVTFSGYAQGEGYRIGFGLCEGTVLPAIPMKN